MTAVTRFQWMRDKEAGQKYGNQEIVCQVDRTVFERYVRPKLGEQWTFEEYRAKYGDLYASLVKRWNNDDFWLSRVRDTPVEAMPNPVDPRWVLLVDSFDSPEAIRQACIADSDLPDDALSVAQIEQDYGYSRRVVYRWLRSGLLQAVKVGRNWLIRRSDLTAHLVARYVPSDTQ